MYNAMNPLLKMFKHDIPGGGGGGATAIDWHLLVQKNA